MFTVLLVRSRYLAILRAGVLSQWVSEEALSGLIATGQRARKGTSHFVTSPRTESNLISEEQRKCLLALATVWVFCPLSPPGLLGLVESPFVPRFMAKDESTRRRVGVPGHYKRLWEQPGTHSLKAAISPQQPRWSAQCYSGMWYLLHEQCSVAIKDHLNFFKGQVIFFVYVCTVMWHNIRCWTASVSLLLLVVKPLPLCRHVNNMRMNGSTIES